MRTILVAAAVVLLAAGCGSSHRTACPTTRGHVASDAVFGRIVVLGGPRVDLYLGGNSGDFRRGRVYYGRSGSHGWHAFKTHFETPPSFRGGFTAHARRLDGSAAVGLGPAPPGGSFTAPAGPVPNQAGGWRDLPVDATWMRSPGCIEYDVTGHGFRERIVVDALKP